MYVTACEVLFNIVTVSDIYDSLPYMETIAGTPAFGRHTCMLWCIVCL